MSGGVAEYARRCLTGQAVGDALGFQVERQGPDACSAFARAWTQGGGRPQPMRDGHCVGQVSDDTQCSLATLQALSTGGGCAAIARSLVAAGPRLVGAGSNTKRMLAALEGRRLDALEVELDARDRTVPAQPSGTNGAAMRAWPVAIAHAEDGDAFEAVRMSSRITHSHPDAIAAAVAAAAVTRAIQQGPRRWIERAIAKLDVGSVERGTLLLGADAAESRPDVAALEIWTAFGRDPKWRLIPPLGIPTVAWALACAIRSKRPRDGIANAIAAGGDVDTAAALTGSWLCGLAGTDDIADLAALVRDGSVTYGDMIGTASTFASAIEGRCEGGEK